MDALIPIFSDKFYDLVFARCIYGGGAYRLIAMEDNRRSHIGRLLGTDRDGVLYIGKADRYVDRVIKLRTGLSPNYRSKAHTCGRRYKSNQKIAAKFPFDSLYIELHPSDKPEESETRLIAEYFNVYGEVPPLNASSSYL